ncbi:DUF3438 family protein [Vibrio sp. S11_S32]|uniref:DUF3438 family protein n=1 Tax=Vibrio sp. S11_S32 TaxID=2720225 RepID=UPI00168075A1|nr:DUF3438 family protein [Vibrio sp. S11_S32]MBD1577105.1 DUF3438 family protein [Vibrio sp. S11_S32]
MKKLLTLSLLFVGFFAHATTALTWDGKPLSIMLEVGKERVIRFTDNVQFRLAESVTNDLSMSTSAGILYVTAKKPLTDVPVDIRLSSTGEIIRIRLTSSKDKQKLDEIKISPPLKKQHMTAFDDSSSEVSNPNDMMSAHEGDPVALIQYAAIRNMMPKRLWKRDQSIAELPSPKNISLKQLFLGKSAGVFDSHIMATYRSGSMVLTAISLKNTTPYPVAIDFRDISIETMFVSVPKPYYSLAEKDNINSKDLGVVYIITKGDFLPYLLAVDPSAIKKPKKDSDDE